MPGPPSYPKPESERSGTRAGIDAERFTERAARVMQATPNGWFGTPHDLGDLLTRESLHLVEHEDGAFAFGKRRERLSDALLGEVLRERGLGEQRRGRHDGKNGEQCFGHAGAPARMTRLGDTE